VLSPAVMVPSETIMPQFMRDVLICYAKQMMINICMCAYIDITFEYFAYDYFELVYFP